MRPEAAANIFARRFSLVAFLLSIFALSSFNWRRLFHDKSFDKVSPEAHEENEKLFRHLKTKNLLPREIRTERKICGTINES